LWFVFGFRDLGRLTIARALLRNSPLVILDDSLSAVDAKTEKQILSEFGKEFFQDRENRKQTTILVSHRLATLKHADRVLVFNQGRIEAEGDHQTLVKNSPTYRHLYALQERGRFVNEG